MKTYLQKALMVALCSAAVHVHAAESPEAVLKKYVVAIGGEEAYRATKTRQMTGVMEIPSQGIKADIKITTKAPNKTRTEMNIPGMGKVVEACDGTVAWSQNPVTGVVKKEGAQLEQAIKAADYYRDIELASRFDSWKMGDAGAKVDGKDAIVLIGTAENGDAETYYFDAETYLLRKVTANVPTVNGNIETATILSDYRPVGDLKVPHLMKMDSAVVSMSMKLNDIKSDIEVPDSVFALPSE